MRQSGSSGNSCGRAEPASVMILPRRPIRPSSRSAVTRCNGERDGYRLGVLGGDFGLVAVRNRGAAQRGPHGRVRRRSQRSVAVASHFLQPHQPWRGWFLLAFPNITAIDETRREGRAYPESTLLRPATRRWRPGRRSVSARRSLNRSGSSATFHSVSQPLHALAFKRLLQSHRPISTGLRAGIGHAKGYGPSDNSSADPIAAELDSLAGK